MGSLERLYDTYSNRVEFLVIYIKEAHPEDGWQVPQNKRDGILIKEPKSLEERRGVAEKACSALSIRIPCLVDTMDDRVSRAYAAWPDRLYGVSKDGTIAVAGPKGPAGFAPALKEAEAWLNAEHPAEVPPKPE